MGFRFRKTIALGKGLRLNLSRNGVSLSVGEAGYTTNIGRKGVRSTYGLPGTGMSYTTKTWAWSPGAGMTIALMVGGAILIGWLIDNL